jgi:hypothetical protein
MTDTYEQYQRDVADAAASFRLAAIFENEHVRYVEAEADTGTRYSVTTAKLPVGADRWAGAPVMVSVLSPWPGAYAMQPTGELHIGYVAEKFAPKREFVHGGDLAALTMTIAHALRREAVLL